MGSRRLGPGRADPAQYLFYLMPDVEGETSRLILVHNWFEELKRVVPN